MVNLEGVTMVEELPVGSVEDRPLGTVKWVGLASVKCKCFAHVKSDDSGKQRRLPCSMMLYGNGVWTQVDDEVDLWYQQAVAFRGEGVEAERACHLELAKQHTNRVSAARKTAKAQAKAEAKAAKAQARASTGAMGGPSSSTAAGSKT